MTELLLYLYTESPLHAGGSENDGVVDLTIQREKATRYPVIWGQSLKGALRQAWRERGLDKETVVFGAADDAAGANAGLLSVGDAQLVAMPVATLRHTFCWVTSSLAVSRLARKYQRVKTGAMPNVPIWAADACLGDQERWSSREVLGPVVVGVEASMADTPHLKAWAARVAADALGGSVMTSLRKKFSTDLLLAGESVAGLLFVECTEQSARVQLKTDQKTVENGPFICEYLPTDTILAASLTLDGCADSQTLEDLRTLLGTPTQPGLIQIGGDETIGKGLVWTSLVEAPGPGGKAQS